MGGPATQRRSRQILNLCILEGQLEAIVGQGGDEIDRGVVPAMRR